MEHTPLFSRTFDFLSWLLPTTNHFPRSQRFILTRRLLDAALDFQEMILEANVLRAGPRAQKLGEASVALDKVRLYLRLALQWKWLAPGQYVHASQMVAEMGRLLGGWQKVTGRHGPASSPEAGAAPTAGQG